MVGAPPLAGEHSQPSTAVPLQQHINLSTGSMIGASVRLGDDSIPVNDPNERVLIDPERDEGNIHIDHDAFSVPGSWHQRRDNVIRLNGEYQPLCVG